MRQTLVGLLGVAWSGLAEAACPSTVAAMNADVDAAVTAFSAMDRTTFLQARDRAREAFPCLTELLTPADIAAYHRMEALHAFVAKDKGVATSLFAASVALQPNYVLPEGLAPDGSPLRTIWDDAHERKTKAFTSIQPPEKMALYVDGKPQTRRATDRPVVLQVTSRSGEVRYTSPLTTGAPNPDWATIAAVQTDKPAFSMPLLAAGAGTVAVAGGLFGGAMATRAKYFDPETPFESLDGLRKGSNTLGYVAQGVGVVGLGLITSSFLVVRF
jgi:hypothetical protein